MADLKREAMLLAEQECRAIAIRTNQLAVLANLVFLAPLGGQALAVQAGAPRVGILRGAAVAAPHAVVDGSWRVCLAHGTHRYGDVVPNHVRSAGC
eukprot:7119413-Karenia_brevis.AAC.1